MGGHEPGPLPTNDAGEAAPPEAALRMDGGGITAVAVGSSRMAFRPRLDAASLRRLPATASTQLAHAVGNA